MPFYGDIEHFKYAINSVVSQSDPDWSLTVFDDQYPSDAPRTFLESINDSRITYLRNETNLGVSGNFQQCIDKAEADFITIMGCDDALLPHYVERVKHIISENKDVAYIQPGVEVIDEDNISYLPLGDKVKNRLKMEFNPPSIASGETLASSLLKGCWTYFPSIAWNTQVLKSNKFRPEFRVVLDLDLQLRIIASGGRVYVDDMPTFAYRRHRKSVSMESARDGSRFVEENLLFTEFAQTADTLGWKKAQKAAAVHLTSRLNALREFPSALLTGHFAGARQLAKHVFGK